jgi:hypothetical protein
MMTTRPRAIPVVLIGGLCTLALGAEAQRGPVRDPASTVSVAGTGSISGTVVTDEASARPVRRATVRLGGADLRVSQVAITDDAGDFTFAALPAGRYMISAARPGFVSTAYGAKRPEGAGSAISLSDGQRVAGLTLALIRGAVITGSVRDQRGNPASDQTVTVMRYKFNAMGQRVLTRAGSSSPQTDDRGIYRVYGLPPGEYLVVATPALSLRGDADAHQMTEAEVQWALRAARNGGPGVGESSTPPGSGQSVVFAPVFYPGTPVETSALRIQLGPGEERSGIDIPLLPVPAANIDGRIDSANGLVPASPLVSLLGHERIEGVPFSGFQTSQAAPDGTFRFTGVPPGSYTIAVRANPGAARPPGGTAVPGPPGLYGLTEVSVNGRDQAAVVMLQRGVTVSGRVSFDGSTPVPPDLTRLNLGLTPVLDASGVAVLPAAAIVDAMGGFAFTGVPPGRYRLSASVPGGQATSVWQPRRAVLDGRDVFDTPLNVSTDDVSGVGVTFSDHVAELSGTIQDADGRPTPEYFLIVFPRDPAYWAPQSRRIQAKRPSSDGRFTFPNTPPGNYLVAAVTDVEPGEWYVPRFLTELAQAAIPVTIAESEKKVQDIRVGR